MCVCVHPWTKGSQPTSAGALSTPWQTQCNEAMPWSGKHGLITRVYLQQFGTVEHAVQCALFVSMVLHDTSHKPTAVLRRFAADFECQIVFECSCQHCSTIRFLRTYAPFRSLAFLPNVGTESLKTNVRVCFAQPSHECDPRHRGAVFA